MPIFLKTLELHFTTQRSALYYSTRHLSGEVYPTICLKKSNEFKTVAVVLLVYQELLHERWSTATKRELGKILKDESNPNNVFVKSAPKNQATRRANRHLGMSTQSGGQLLQHGSPKQTVEHLILITNCDLFFF